MNPQEIDCMKYKDLSCYQDEINYIIKVFNYPVHYIFSLLVKDCVALSDHLKSISWEFIIIINLKKKKLFIFLY